MRRIIATRKVCGDFASDAERRVKRTIRVIARESEVAVLIERCRAGRNDLSIGLNG